METRKGLGLKIQKEIIEKSENRLKPLLSIKIGVKSPIIFHGSYGSPDWIVIDDKAKIHCFELKPIDSKNRKSMIPTPLQEKRFLQILKKRIPITLVYYQYNPKRKKFNYGGTIELYKSEDLRQIMKLSWGEIINKAKQKSFKLK